MKKADEIFEQSKYLSQIAKLQKRDMENAFEGNTGLPEWYTKNDEPR